MTAPVSSIPSKYHHYLAFTSRSAVLDHSHNYTEVNNDQWSGANGLLNIDKSKQQFCSLGKDESIFVFGITIYNNIAGLIKMHLVVACLSNMD